MKKFFAIVLCLVMLFSISAPVCSAALNAPENSISTDGDDGFNTEPVGLDDTVDPIEITVTAQDGIEQIYNALALARDNASTETPYVIYVESGTYELYKAFHIYSNTSIVAVKGAVFRQANKNPRTGETFNGDNMVKVGTVGADPVKGYGYENITISGGEWDSNGKAKTMFKFCHAKNCKIENVKAHDILNAHFVEIAGVDGFTLRGCTFYNMEVTVQDGREAVQIDVLHSYHISGYEHLEDEIDTLCKNIVIDGCTFKGVKRAIGSHTVVQGKYYENVAITNNTFSSTVEKSILCFNMQNLIVSGNVINGGHVGIEVKTMDRNAAGVYLSKTDKTYHTKPNIVPLHAEISNNIIKSTSNHAIFIDGVILSKAVSADPAGEKHDRIPAGNYYVDDVNIHDNTLTAFGKSCPIKVQFGKNITVDHNIITEETTSETPIYITDGSQKITVTDNVINVTALNGIRVANLMSGYPKGSVSIISGNTIANVVSNGYGIRLSDATVDTVEKNVIQKSGNIGIQADKNSKTGYSVSVSKISENTIGKSKTAIKLMTATVGEISGNKIAATTAHSIHLDRKAVAKIICNNTITSSGGTAIILSNSKGGEISDNVIKNPKIIGIYCYNGSSCDSISVNSISGAVTNGIGVNTGVVGRIENNTITSCKNFGIYLNADKRTQVGIIRGNTISSCVLGIKILKGPKAGLYTNTLRKNKEGNNYVINGTRQYKLGNLPSVTPLAKKSGSAIKVSWKKKSTVSAYTIYRSTKPDSKFVKIGTTEAKAKSYIDKKAKAKVTYYYKVIPNYRLPGSNVTMYAEGKITKGVKR